MTLIQLLLTLGIIIISAYMYIRLRSTLLDVILIILFLITGIFFVLFPDTSTDIAKLVGVSRGADLLFYFSILFLLFLILKLYSRLRRIEQKFTELVREKSLEEADIRGKKN